MYRVIVSLALINIARSHICVGPLCITPNDSGHFLKIFKGYSGAQAPQTYHAPVYPVMSPMYPITQPVPQPAVSRFDDIASRVVALDRLQSCRYDVSESFNQDSYILQYNLPSNYNLNDLQVKMKHRVIHVRGAGGWLDDVRVLPLAVRSQAAQAFWSVDRPTLRITFGYSTQTERRACPVIIDEDTVLIQSLDYDVSNLYRNRS